jgi:molybdopterin biosynthesis enzyme
MPPLSYPSALAYLRSLPSSSSSNPPTTSLPLLQTLSRSCPHPICASAPGLPPFDNSAMDGYLLDPSLVRSASKTDAVLLRVRGSLAAGDEPLSSSATREEAGDRSEGSEQVQGEEVKGDCWEMMTGAPFPDGEAYTGWGCVKHEIVEVVEGGKYVRIVEPVPERANRRPAGEVSLRLLLALYRCVCLPTR